MNIGIIVNPNSKGQVVIPKKMRDAVSISEKTPLELTIVGQSIVIHPIKGIERNTDAENSYIEILKRTAGSWSGDDWRNRRLRRESLEKKASSKRKSSW